MLIGIAGMSHETNTFSPVITDLKRFSGSANTPPSGDRALKIYRGTGTCVGGFIQVCASRRYTFEVGIAAGAAPSGPVENDAYELMTAAMNSMPSCATAVPTWL